MYGIFVNSRGVPYALAIAGGYKRAETRARDMLRRLIGQRVAVIETGKGKAPAVVGYVTITGAEFIPADKFDSYRELTLIPPGSRYDCHGRGKWLYYLAGAELCQRYELPADAVRHGRSYCEFTTN